MDYALRRRFAFVDVNPAFLEPAFKAHLRGLPDAMADSIVSRMHSLNSMISTDPTLGIGFQIGHSYFCRDGTQTAGPWDGDATIWWEDVIRHEVDPLIKEYWYDSPAELERARSSRARSELIPDSQCVCRCWRSVGEMPI